MSSVSETIDIENVVASTDIGQELALDSLAMDLSGSEYNPDAFPGLIYRTQEPKATNLIFRSGKIVCTGGTSINDVHSSLQTVCEMLRDLGIDVSEDPAITIQNIVSSADLGAQLNLNAIAIGFGLKAVEYEPEQFPGLVYRLDTPDVVALVFVDDISEMAHVAESRVTNAYKTLNEELGPPAEPVSPACSCRDSLRTSSVRTGSDSGPEPWRSRPKSAASRRASIWPGSPRPASTRPVAKRGDG
jgi:transcription initiation factor TFIID TATA-box-binding protein